MYKKILIAYDGSAGAKLALRRAVALAKTCAAEIEAVWVRSSVPHFPETVGEITEETEAADAYLRGLRTEVESVGREAEVAITCTRCAGHPAKSILRHAETAGFDLIVLGSRGHSELWGRIIGHTTDRVSEHAHCDVLIVRAEDLPT